VAVVLVAGAVGTARATGRPLVLGPYGHGAGRVWLLLPRSRPRSIVVFLHGWKLAPPSPAAPWVGQFRPWLDHLVSGGSAVVFPAYQTGGDAQGPARVASLRDGLETGFRRLGRSRLPVVVAGYSYGASLGFAYAANAGRWRLPRPAAVDLVFPAEMIPGAALPPLPARVRVLIEVGDEDVVAGRAGAEQFLAWLAHRPGRRQRLVVVRSRNGFAAVHAAPKLATAAARRAFWTPLDRLIAAAR
jgi:hypothetical protein